MRNRMTSVCDQLIDFLTGIVNWLWDTFELVLDILLEFVVRAIELALAILHLGFQVVCFLRDLCIEAMQTFANVFRGVVNVVSSIKCEDVEDFATACIVVLLWVGAVKVALGVLDRIGNKTGTLPSNCASRIPKPGLLPLPDIFTSDKSRWIKLPGRHYSRNEQKTRPFPNPLSMLAPANCASPMDKPPNLVQKGVKKKMTEARRGVGKQPANSSISSTSSGSSDLGD